MRRKNRGSFTIVVDSREQRAYKFKGAVVTALKAGDYSIDGLEDRIAIERKRPEELFLCAGRERDRFVRELERLADFDYAAIVVEGSLVSLLEPSAFSRVGPKVVLNSLVSWSVKYNVSVWFAGSRRLARTLTYRILEKFWKHRREIDVRE